MQTEDIYLGSAVCSHTHCRWKPLQSNLPKVTIFWINTIGFRSDKLLQMLLSRWNYTEDLYNRPTALEDPVFYSNRWSFNTSFALFWKTYLVLAIGITVLVLLLDMIDNSIQEPLPSHSLSHSKYVFVSSDILCRRSSFPSILQCRCGVIGHEYFKLRLRIENIYYKSLILSCMKKHSCNLPS